jgi:IS30 family transposase
MKRKFTQLGYEERVLIAQWIKEKRSMRYMASELGRSPNTIAREIREKRVKDVYTPKKAQHKTYWRRYRAKRGCMKVAMSKELSKLVHAKLPLRWSPERIAGHATKEGLPVSKKAVYKYVKSRCLERYLFWKRVKKKSGRKRSHASPADRLKRLIEARPPCASSGHWELDFIVSSFSGVVLLVMVDRWTRYTVVTRLERKTHALVLRALADIAAHHEVKTITTDNDIVLQKWQEMETGLPGVSFFFCHPYHSWEKGLVENTNRWIRTFVPKKCDLATVSDEDIRSIHAYLNDIPRQCLGFSTAREVLSAAVS